MPDNRQLASSRNIEIITGTVPLGGYRAVLFDWDGTISLIREGWQGIMNSMMVAELLELRTRESVEELKTLVAGFIDRLTGKQTIYQMIHLCEEISRRNGVPGEAQVYNQRYKDLLDKHIADRLDRLIAGGITPSELMLPGTVDLLENLNDRGMALYLASGTDHVNLLRESSMLGVSCYFGDRIFGAQEQYHTFSKAMVVQEILKTVGIEGTELIGFGDGPVEIADVKAVGGTAIGVAFDEACGHGIDRRKRDHLAAAGADFIIPDFREQEILISYLTGEL